MSGRIAFYGSLLRSFGQQSRLGVSERTRYRGEGLVAGRLYDLGRYPGLLAGGGTVRVEIYEPLDEHLLAYLDEFEGYDPSRPDSSQYLRVQTDLVEPGGEVWIYRYNRSVEGKPPVPSGCWESYWRESRCGATPSS